jgi:hypothetical protein
MGAYSCEELKPHIGHKVHCTYYGEKKDPANVAVECEKCNVVLMDFDHPDLCGEHEESPFAGWIFVNVFAENEHMYTKLARHEPHLGEHDFAKQWEEALEQAKASSDEWTDLDIEKIMVDKFGWKFQDVPTVEVSY